EGPEGAWEPLSAYVQQVAPELFERVHRFDGVTDVFAAHRIDEQIAKALERKVFLPSGGSLVIDRTEAMTVVDVNTGKYTGSGGNLEQTVTRNNLEAAEEIVRQLRLRDLGGIVVIDFIDMVLESNRELVLRRLTECLGRDRTKHQVAEVTSLGLVQMTRKRVGEGLLEAFSEPCQTCNGRGLIVHMDPVDRKSGGGGGGNNASAVEEERPARGKRTRKPKAEPVAAQPDPAELEAENTKRRAAASAIAAIAAATAHHDEHRPDSVEQNGAAPVLAEVAVADQVGSDRTGPASTQSNGSAPAADATGSAAPTRPRRRRAASRPAGPPITAEASSAD
ncbi:MAG: ribonuclease E/G, partial [Jatrophihabitantaceae bacterium]